MLGVLEAKLERACRQRWFGHVQRSDQDYIGRWMLSLELTGRRPRGRSKRRRYMDVVRADRKETVVTVDDAMRRVGWRNVIRCGDP